MPTLAYLGWNRRLERKAIEASKSGGTDYDVKKKLTNERPL